MADRPIPPILLVRLKPRGPGGTVIGESRRVCHLVPVPQSADVPVVLRAYCGVEIPPGAAEWLDAMSGMPCEPCLAGSPIPAFAMLRLTSSAAAGAAQRRDEVPAWWDVGLLPEQKITARFVLLILLQDPARYLSVSEIALWLGHDPQAVHLIMLLYASVGWIQVLPDQSSWPWAERRFQLTESGTSLAPRLLAEGMTTVFQLLAGRLGLDTTIVSTPDAPDPGGCGTPPTAAPTGHHPDTNNTTAHGGEET